MRAVVDTNVWVSGFITPLGHGARVISAVRMAFFEPVFCPAALGELRATCLKPRLVRRYGIGMADANKLAELLALRGLGVADPVVIPICRDPRDDIFIALALASKADYLVSGDGDIQDDEAVVAHLAAAGTMVVSVRQFLEILD